MKLVLDDEPGAELASALWEEADVAVSARLLHPEARAAVASAHRARRVGARRLRGLVKQLEKLHADLDVVGLDDALARSAGDLAERHALRGYDAVHLASALAIDLPGELVVATWDRELAAAALAEGRMVVPAQ